MLEGYEKLKTVGKGTFGTATLYRRLTDSKYVVVKEIFTMDMDDQEKRSASNEVEVISTLNHQNIIRYIESFVQEESLKIVMEYADGGNLARLINLKKHKNDIFTERGILDIVFQISAALSYMHSKKILHRDLKTANIFISMNGIIKLGDFGISKMLNTKSQAQTVVGTPYYLSPEICKGHDYNEKSDVWALGCILYELAALKKPFNAQNLPVLVEKITSCRYENIPQIYSEYLSHLVHAILQRNPENRPFAGEIHDMLIPKMQNAEENERLPESPMSNQSIPETRSILYEISNFCNDKVINPIELPHKNIIHLSVGSTHNLIVTADHAVYAWGDNNYGQLALGNTESHKKYPVCANYLRNKNIIKSAAGQNFSLFLNSQGLVFSCGDGSKGCLGHEDFTNVVQPKICDSLVTSPICDICCGSHHCVALTTNGRIFSWGLSKYGELGLGPLEKRNKPTIVNLPTKIDRIFCSEDATLLLATNGKILVAGRNNFNKLGVAQEGDLRTFHALLHSYGHIKTVSMSADRTFLVNEEGQLVVMGKRSYNDRDEGSNAAPQIIRMDSKITMSTCTPRFVAVADNQNVVWFWGSYKKRINGESSSTSESDKTQNNKYNSVVSLLRGNKSHVKQLLSSSFQTVHVKNPKSILALFASKDNIRNGNIIQLGDIKAKDNSLLVVVNATTPPHTKTFSSSYATTVNNSFTAQEEFPLENNFPILNTR